MNTGTKISGIGHGALIAWLLLGGLFSRELPKPPETADVSLISFEEFAALSQPQTGPNPALDISPPELPEVEAVPIPVPRPQAAPIPAEAPAAEAPAAPDATPAVPDAPEPERSEVSDDVAVLLPPGPDAAAPTIAPPSETPQPRAAPRVAPLPVPETPLTPQIADTASPRVSPDADTDQRAEDLPAAAPEEATTEIVTEAETPSRAPVVSARPTARPPRPVRQAATAPASDAIADAVAAAVANTAAPATPQPAAAPSVPSGPPLTGGEKDALRIAVQQCWNVGSLSSEALATTVVVGVTMARDGRPESGSIQMLGSSGGTADAARQAYEAARRAIIRCGANGYGLPAEKYGQWRDIEITFNPESMRIK